MRLWWTFWTIVFLGALFSVAPLMFLVPIVWLALHPAFYAPLCLVVVVIAWAWPLQMPPHDGD